MGALRTFLTAKGFTFSEAAVAAGVDVKLLVRVDSGDQPIPYVTCVAIADVLELDLGDVVRACRQIIRRAWQMDFNPRPSRVPDQPPRPPATLTSQTQTSSNSVIDVNLPPR